MRKSKKRAKVKAHCRLGTPVASRACAYCRLHQCTMTVRQMKNRQCLVKKCQHFRPWKQHTYWATHGPWRLKEETE